MHQSGHWINKNTTSSTLTCARLAAMAAWQSRVLHRVLTSPGLTCRHATSQRLPVYLLLPAACSPSLPAESTSTLLTHVSFAPLQVSLSLISVRLNQIRSQQITHQFVFIMFCNSFPLAADARSAQRSDLLFQLNDFQAWILKLTLTFPSVTSPA